MDRAYGMHWEQERCIQGFGEDPEGKRPFGRPRHRWEDNIKVDLKEVGCGLNQGGSGQGQMAGTCECGNEPSGSVKCR